MAERGERMSWYSRPRAGRSHAIPLVLLAVGVLVSAGMLLAPALRADELPISLDLRGVALGMAVNMVSVQSGAQILFVDREGTLPGRLVTLTARPRNVEVALRLLCRAAECYWWKDADGIYMISLDPKPE